VRPLVTPGALRATGLRSPFAKCGEAELARDRSTARAWAAIRGRSVPNSLPQYLPKAASFAMSGAALASSHSLLAPPVAMRSSPRCPRFACHVHVCWRTTRPSPCLTSLYVKDETEMDLSLLSNATARASLGPDVWLCALCLRSCLANSSRNTSSRKMGPQPS
jgi:hypothetical protein